MKKEIQKSSLLIFYKLISELSSIGFKGELEIGVSEQEFDKFKLENFAFMYKADKKSIKEYESSNEFKFNTGAGTLTIYNKDSV
jgi:hypothetical protein